MKFLKRSFLGLLLALGCTGMGWSAPAIPNDIQDGNILHCFNWSINQVKEALPEIAAAGFGSVQLSPLQRPDVKAGESWHALYRPYDLAFKSSTFMGGETELKALCDAAAALNIKVIVDVVANHVDKTAGYHDTWWDSNGRIRWNGGINYGDRYSITHGQLGDYGDINSENADVIARGKAYVEKLKSLGVKGCRWDAAKHIGLPSESCGFWSAVTSVAGMYHYGEILDAPGPNSSIIKEYAQYMSVTDNRYSNGGAKDNGGIFRGFGGEWVVNQGLSDKKLVYWAESHDTYANDEWSQNVDQSVIDRAYACIACRNGATALYLARPSVKGFNNIKVGKGSTAFKANHIAAVNAFRNAMVGRADWCEAGNNTFCVTRQGGGAVIVMKGSGQVSVTNGGGYCPAGTYTDKISGNKFTVTTSTISGQVGSTGIAVLYEGDGPTPPHGGDDPDPTPPVTGSMWILGNLANGGWSTTPGTGCAMTLTDGKYVANSVEFKAAAGETRCYFNITDYVGSTWDDLNMQANRYGAATEGQPLTEGTTATVVKYANNVDAMGCLSWTVAPGTYKVTFDPTAMTILIGEGGGNVNPPGPGPDPENLPAINGVYLKNTANWSQPRVWAWNGSTSIMSSSWPGDAMTKYNDTYWKWELPAGKTATGILFNGGGDDTKTADLVYTNGGIYDCSGQLLGTAGGDDPTPPGPQPPVTGDVTIYYDNSATNWSKVHIHYWSTPNTEWPGVAMTKVDGNIYSYTFPSSPAGLAGFLFCDGSGSGDNNQTADYTSAPVNGHLYKGAGGSKGAVSDMGEYQGGNVVTSPTVTASPASGTRFTDNITVSLSVSPAATIYYTTNGSAPTTSSSRYTAPLTFTETTTLKTLAVTAEGGKKEQTFTYTKRGTVEPITGNNVITDYYKVNPNGQFGSNRTVNMKFTKLNSDNRMCVADNALSNWTPQDLIAQGVARDIASSIRGKHEYPCVDSYAVYAAYDSQNLYLGVQYVYSTWDLWGDGILSNGAAKPYNMDGRIIIAFDLDPEVQFEGVLANGSSIWDEGGKFNTFNNGTDAILYCSTKSTVGQPGLFVPDPQGHASYGTEYCKSIPAPFYGCQDGLLPSITEIWGQEEFGYDPEDLKGNDGFTNIKGKCNDDQHTFYEWKLPLSVLGINENYIKTEGIGVMVIDTYGQGAIGSTPYDPCTLDNASKAYSKDESSSMEKEDHDIFTFAHARIGKGGQGSGIEAVAAAADTTDAPREYFNLQGVPVLNPEAGQVYILRQGNKVQKVVIR